MLTEQSVFSGKQNQDSSPSRARDHRTPSLRGVGHLSLSGPPPSSANHQPIHPYVNARGPTLPLIAAHFASALVSAVCPAGLGWLVVLRAPHALSESLPAPSIPSKGTFLCLCPPHGAPPLVGGWSQNALLPSVPPRARGMVVSPPVGQLTPPSQET